MLATTSRPSPSCTAVLTASSTASSSDTSAAWAVMLPVASVAAIVSYRHLSGLLAFYGEDTITATIGPLAVDGLMVMATGALLATTRENPTTQERPDTVAVTEPARATETTTGTNSTTGQAARSALVQPGPKPRAVARAGSRGSSTAQRIARVRARHPEWTTAQVAEHLGISPRTARRYSTPDTAGSLTTDSPDLQLVSTTPKDHPATSALSAS